MPAKRRPRAKPSTPKDPIAENRAKRRHLVDGFMQQIADLVKQQYAPYRIVVYNHREDKWVEHMLPTPDAKALQAISIAIGIRVDKVLQLQRFDEGGSEPTKAAIVALVDKLTAEAAADKVTQLPLARPPEQPPPGRQSRPPKRSSDRP